MDAFVAPHTAHLLLQWLLALTAISSAALLLILPLRPLLRRLGGPALAYAVWALLPLALLAALLPHPVTTPVLPLWTSDTALLTPEFVITSAEPHQPTVEAETWLMLWLAGATLLFTAMVWQQGRIQRGLALSRATGHRRVLRSSRTEAGPLVLGLFRPRIVLPADFRQRYDCAERTLVLAHEAAHVRHGDLVINALAAALQVVFWFNPLVHLACARLRFDQELACDGAVLRRHPGRRQAYAHAILKAQLAAQPALGALQPMTCHWQSRHPLKERIMQLARPAPRPLFRHALRTGLVAAALAAGYGAWAAVADLEAVHLTAPARVSNPEWAAPASPVAAGTTAPAPVVAAASAAAPAEPATTVSPNVAKLSAKAQRAASPATPLSAYADQASPTPQVLPTLPSAPTDAAPSGRTTADVTPPYPAPAADRALLRASSGYAWRIESGNIISMRFQPEGSGKQPREVGSTPELAAKQRGPAPDGSPRYRVAMEHTITLAGKTQTSNFAIAVAPSESATVTVNEDGRQCKFTLRVNPRGDDTVALDVPVDCDDGKHHPRLVTRLGEPATIEFGRAEGVVQKFKVVVTAPEA